MCCFPCYLWCNRPRRCQNEDDVQFYDEGYRWLTASRHNEYRYLKLCLLINVILTTIIIFQNWPKLNQLLQHYDIFDLTDITDKYTLAALYPLQTCKLPKNVKRKINNESIFKIAIRKALHYEANSVWQPMNFSLRLDCSPFPVLNWHDQFQCNRIFGEWLKIAANSEHKNPIQNQTLPKVIYDAYHSNGTLLKIAANNSEHPKEHAWTAASIEQYLYGPLTAIYELSGYGKFAGSMQLAFRRYQERIRNSRGLVIGSVTPWIELLALRYGASSITTVDHRPIRMGDKRMHYMHPIQLAKHWENQSVSYDFIASYSSIEHSGLGLYGEPLDPIGDLREMHKLHCLLRYDSLMFIGFPVGRDDVVYNAHRVYSSERMAMMFAGWRLQAVYYDDRNDPYDFSAKDFNERAPGPDRAFRRLLFVLKKN